MKMKLVTPTNHDYTVGWIAALQIELAAAKGMLDEMHHFALPQEAGDTNNYTLGRIGSHNVVIACLPSMGNNAAAFAAANMLRSFPNVRIGLMVGIGGGAIDDQGEDIRLGDVVVSTPDGTHGGVVQFDFGTAIQTSNGQEFVVKGYLNRPPSSLLSALKTLQANAEMEGPTFGRYYEEMLRKYPAMAVNFKRPAIDKLYHKDYIHQSNKADCSECSDAQIVPRGARTTSFVHYGLVGSSNEVLRNAEMRDKWHTEKGIICFEMEAAGLMNDFPCLVIRGICDYCDTHKNKNWQRFASAQAAAFAKELLMNLSPIQIETHPPPSWILEAFDHQLDEHRITQNAIKEIRDKLEDTTEYDLQCLAKVKATDPRMDKERIESTKGGLLQDSYIWILRAEEFKAWLEHHDKLLWIRGDPGKGKTMLLCGIITELSKEQCFLSYFFCQASQNQLNSAVSVLRGIIFLLADQQPALIKYIKKHTDKSLKSVFEDNNAWFTLVTILRDCLEDRLTEDVIILIDALDECIEGRQNLLSFIVSCSRSYPARWIISSRNWPEIEKDLKSSREKAIISLELNAASVSAAVRSYIDYRIEQLTARQDYDEETREEVARYLIQHARDTFLWVSLVCAYLEEVNSWETISALEMFPPGLDDLYRHMLQRILSSRNSAILVQILALSTVVYRPLEIGEMMVLLDAKAAMLRSSGIIKELVNLCGSFLTVKDLRIELVHQSAKDFLLAEGAKSIFIQGQQPIHRQICVKSLEKLHSILVRDIYSLKDPSVTIGSISRPNPDPLENIKYSCIYWMDHLMEQYDDCSGAQIPLKDMELVQKFIKEKFIYWLEASSLLRGIATLALSISKLWGLLPPKMPLESNQDNQLTQLQNLLEDAIQFVRYFRHPLESFPLQVYVSGLLFSPSSSTLKHIFAHEVPKWADIKRGLKDKWPVGITLGYETQGPDGLQFSPGNDQIATVTVVDGPAICGWDVKTGRQTFNLPHPEHSGGLAGDWHFRFLENDKLVTGDAPFEEIRLWSLPRGQLQQTISMQVPKDFAWKAKAVESATDNGFSHYVTDLDFYYANAVFSRDALLLARHTAYNSVEIYETLSGTLKFHVESEWGITQTLNITDDNLHVVSCNLYKISLWNIQTECMLWSTTEISTVPTSIFLPRNMIAITTHDLQLWDWSRNQQIYSLNDFLCKVPAIYRSRPAVFQPLTERLLVASPSALLEIDTRNEAPAQLLRRFRSDIKAVACSSDGKTIAVGDSTAIDIWNASSIAKEEASVPVSYEPRFRRLYLCGDFVVSFGTDNFIEVHIASITGDIVHDSITYVDFYSQCYEISPSRCFVAFTKDDGTIETWDLVNQTKLARFLAGTKENSILGIAWDSQNKFISVITAHLDWLTHWDAAKGDKVKRWTLPKLPSDANSTHYLHWSWNNTYLIIVSEESIDILNTDSSTWQNLAREGDESTLSRNMAFSPDEALFAYVNWKNGLRVWNTNTMELIITVYDIETSCSFIVDRHWVRTDEVWCRISVDTGLVEDPELYDSNHVNMDINSFSWSVRDWIRFGSRDMIWIPGEYLPRRPVGNSRYWDIVGDRIAIGLTHDILILDVSWDKWAAENGEHFFEPVIEQLNTIDKRGWSLTSRPKSNTVS